MSFHLNPNELSSFFAVPTSVADTHIKLAGAIHLKVLLLALRKNDFTTATIADILKISDSDVVDSFNYWADAGVLISTENVKIADPIVPKKAVKKQITKPSREEVTRRGFESPEVVFLLREAELKFGRALRQTEASTLLWLFDDEGMDISLILMLLEYAIGEEKINVGFIERTAVEWINAGVSDITSAESYINDMHSKKSAWYAVCAAMSIERRSPSPKELQLAHQWVSDWQYGRDILRRAYEECVDAISKFSMPYVKKILDGWHKSGVKTIEDLTKLEKPSKPIGKITHDIDMATKSMFE